MSADASGRLFAQATRLMPGGVSSPVRSFKAVGGVPRFVVSGAGPSIVDADGKTYIDLVGSWGPLILGHAHPAVVDAVTDAARNGATFGAPTQVEIDLAEMIICALPSIESIRFVSSGTEAAMSALRLARAATGRRKLLKFAGCYHGHADAFLASAGSGALTHGDGSSPGVPPGVAADTIVEAYNDVAAVHEVFRRHGGDIAAVFVEPIAANMGVVPPAPGFLEALRSGCDGSGAVLVFDEVVTGFRVGWSGAQGMFGIRPDLTILGKVIGGGLPIGAYGGRRDLMEQIAPAGPVYQAGTLSGNPLAMAAGIATLRTLQDKAPYANLDRVGRRLADGLSRAAAVAGVPVALQRAGSMFTMYFNESPVANLADAKRSDLHRFRAFFHAMLEAGAWLPPSQFEAAFLSTAHGEEHIDLVVEAAAAALARA